VAVFERQLVGAGSWKLACEAAFGGDGEELGADLDAADLS
jgi:hypothetical protein